MHYRKKLTLLLLLIALFLYSGYQLFFARINFFSEDKTNSRTILASIQTTLNIVKKRPENHLLWYEVAANSELALGDQVFTHENSSTSILFRDGNQITLGEKSLIKIEESKENFTVNIQRGTMQLELATSQWQVRMGKTLLELNGKDAKVQLHNNSLQLLSGTAKIKAQEKEFQLDSKQTLNIQANSITITKQPFVLQAPSPNQIFYHSPPSAIQFKWTSDNLSETQILVATDSSLSKPFLIRNVVIPSYTLNQMKPGTYYWALEGKNKNGKIRSPVFSFLIMPNPAPRIVLPERVLWAQELIEKKPSLNVLLEWQDLKATKYQIEILKGKQIVLNQSTDQNRFVAQDLAPGNYSLRVKASYSDHPDSPWSTYHPFEIKVSPLPKPPQLIFPTDKHRFNTKKIKLKWDTSKELETMLEIYHQQKSIFSQTYHINATTWTAPQVGTYCLQLRSRDRYLRRSNPSPQYCFEIVPPAPDPEQLTQKILFLPQKFTPPIFRWKSNSPEQPANYLFELANDDKFQRIILKEQSTQPYISWPSPQHGHFYWRVKSVVNQVESDFSIPASIIITPPPPPSPPQIGPGMIFEIKPEIIETSSWWPSLILSCAHADELVPVALLKWNKEPSAVKYLLQIYADPNGKTLLLHQQTSANQFKWQHAKPGTYYWQLAIIDQYNRQSAFSPLVKMILRPSLTTTTSKPHQLTLLHAPLNLNYDTSSETQLVTVKGSTANSLNAGYHYQLNPFWQFNLTASYFSQEVFDNPFTLWQLEPAIDHSLSFLLPTLVTISIGGNYRNLTHSEPLNESSLSALAQLMITRPLITKLSHSLKLSLMLGQLTGGELRYLAKWEVNKSFNLQSGIELGKYSGKQSSYRIIRFLWGGGYCF